jgi:transposase
MEIIRLVEQSAWPVKRTLTEFGLSRSTFYRWYRRYLDDGHEGLANRCGHDLRFWNRIPDRERQRVVVIALATSERSPREVAFAVTDTEGWFISESSVYRILKSLDLITSPAYAMLSAAEEFRHKTSAA